MKPAAVRIAVPSKFNMNLSIPKRIADYLATTRTHVDSVLAYTWRHRSQ